MLRCYTGNRALSQQELGCCGLDAMDLHSAALWCCSKATNSKYSIRTTTIPSPHPCSLNARIKSAQRAYLAYPDLFNPEAPPSPLGSSCLRLSVTIRLPHLSLMAARCAATVARGLRVTLVPVLVLAACCACGGLLDGGSVRGV
jgi:hypothetical protein